MYIELELLTLIIQSKLERIFLSYKTENLLRGPQQTYWEKCQGTPVPTLTILEIRYHKVHHEQQVHDGQ